MSDDSIRSASLAISESLYGSKINQNFLRLNQNHYIDQGKIIMFSLVIIKQVYSSGMKQYISVFIKERTLGSGINQTVET